MIENINESKNFSIAETQSQMIFMYVVDKLLNDDDDIAQLLNSLTVKLLSAVCTTLLLYM